MVNRQHLHLNSQYNTLVNEGQTYTSKVLSADRVYPVKVGEAPKGARRLTNREAGSSGASGIAPCGGPGAPLGALHHPAGAGAADGAPGGDVGEGGAGDAGGGRPPRIVRLRGVRSDRGPKARRDERRLYIKGPLEAGDILRAPDGFEHTLVGELRGSPARPHTARLFQTVWKDKSPRVLVWRFTCKTCGAEAKTNRGASWRPIRRRCVTCSPRREKTGE